MATTTLDAAGEVTGRWDQGQVSLAEARRAAGSLTGPIWQVPPMVSAVKVGGRRLHQLARQGVEVERAAREVTVWRFDRRCGRRWTAVRPTGGPVLAVSVECSSGTYVRVLAADLGAALGGGAHLRRLRRTAVGPWSIDSAVPLDALTAADLSRPRPRCPGSDLVVVPAGRASEVQNGRVSSSGPTWASGVTAPGGSAVPGVSFWPSTFPTRHGPKRRRGLVRGVSGAWLSRRCPGS